MLTSTRNGENDGTSSQLRERLVSERAWRSRTNSDEHHRQRRRRKDSVDASRKRRRRDSREDPSPERLEADLLVMFPVNPLMFCVNVGKIGQLEERTRQRREDEPIEQ